MRTFALTLCCMASVVHAQNAPIDVCSQWRNFTNTSVSTGLALDGGFLWLGTTGGLVRIDTATHAHTLFQKTNSGLPVNWITTVLRDRNGVIFVGTYEGGLARYDHGVWYTYTTRNSILPGSTVQSLALDSSGDVWIGCGGGVVQWSKGQLRKVVLPLDKDFTIFPAIAISATNEVWIGANSHDSSAIIHFDGIRWIYYSHRNSTMLDNNVSSIACATDGTIWVGYAYMMLQAFDGSTWSGYAVQPGNGGGSGYVNAILVDKQNNVWVSNYLGVGRLSPSGKWRTYGSGGTNALLLSENVVWAATTPGLMRIEGTDHTNYFDWANSTLVSNELMHGGMTVDTAGRIWALSQGTTGTDSSPIAVGDDTSWKQIIPTGYVDEFGNVSPIQLATDSTGAIWATIPTIGLARYDGTLWYVFNDTNSGLHGAGWHVLYSKKSHSIWVDQFLTSTGALEFNGTTWTSHPGAFPAFASVTAIAMDTSGGIWLGGYDQGASYFDGAQWHLYNSSNSSIPGWVGAIACEASGSVWIGTDHGVARRSETGAWQVFTTSNSPLPWDEVTAIAVDHRERVWIATFGHGVAIYDHGIWQVIDQTNSGLTNWDITSIQVDFRGNVWVAMEYAGLAVFNDHGFARPAALFQHDTVTNCAENPLDRILVELGGCSGRRIVRQSIAGADAAYYSIIDSVGSFSIGLDSIVIAFEPHGERAYDARLEVLLEDSSLYTIPLAGNGGPAQPFSVSSNGVASDAIGEEVSVPLVVGSSRSLEELACVLHYDTSMLVYTGTSVSGGGTADITAASSAHGVSHLQFERGAFAQGDTIGYARFRVYPVDKACADVTFDSVSYVALSDQCLALTNTEVSTHVCSSIRCETSILSQYLRYQQMPTLRMSPNPASDHVTLTVDHGSFPVRIEVLSELGSSLATQTGALSASSPLRVDLSNLPEGSCYVRVVGEGWTRTLRAVHKY